VKIAVAAAAWLAVAVGAGQVPGATVVSDTERARVLSAANMYLTGAPQTITSFRAARSAGGLDFFSEGDYWWRDPRVEDVAYIVMT